MINPGQILQNRYQAIQLLGDSGFGQTWEVDDGGTRKILKILQVPKAIDDEEMEQVIALFEQEANVLKELHDLGLPKVEPEAYFIESTEGVGLLHCLVMEKIEGINLSEWLKHNHHNQSIEEEQAIAWLTQLVEIISKLHQHHCIHRDIKPTNIMLRTSTVQNQNPTIVQQIVSENLSQNSQVESKDKEVTNAENLSPISLTPKNVAQQGNNTETLGTTEGDKRELEKKKNHIADRQQSPKQEWGQLALIDFGAMRQVTETYVKQVEGKDVTGIISQGYTSPEQYEGKVTRQSDVFAIGRTLVYLLTAEKPTKLPTEPQTGRLMWRDRATHISQELADLIDEMMENLPQCRPQTTEDILERLATYKQQVETETEVELLPTQKQQPTAVTENKYYSRLLQLKLLNFQGKSQKTKPKPNKWLGKISLFTLGVIAVVIAFLPEAPTTCPLKFDDKLSCGEEILIPGSAAKDKEKGVKAFADGNYLQAVMLLEAARNKQINDPEILIYLNNAKLAANNTEAYTIAVAVPITGESRAFNYSLEILRGVAQAQEEINQSDTADATLRERRIGGKGLIVIIADDVNSSAQAVIRANDLAATGQVLAVVGHLSSQITMEVAQTYEENQLVLIAPTANSSMLSNRNNFFFRMIPSDATIAQAMASYLISQSEDEQPKVALFHIPNDVYSESLKNQFSLSFTAGRGKVVKDLDEKFDLSRTAFNASAAIDRADKQEATAIVLLPDIFNLSKGIEVIKANWQLNLPIVAGDSLYNDYTLKFGADEAEGKLVVATPWHSLNSPNLDFPQQAKELWGGAVSWRTAFAYDSVQALITALESLPERKELNRIALQQALASEDFSSYGATGDISFLGNGDRQESKISFTQVVKSSCSPLGYTFLPLDYPVSKFNLLECEE
ncbi:MAG: ABC transporter substrate-binding protein [Okeania sp. SIO3I5]|uniref:ABC transporter substrate-binding protein n=1 Tax=Okeania sp. SIO3I5 TaxID=2607805 RepID=UPI0013BC74C3|nr:ABC transporter substrate-binding protein [Okeania sp. SIO3I5]NEQ36232.1 ABC transporter substrate-binding protein [Okeania sp. SIO3I5]